MMWCETSVRLSKEKLLLNLTKLNWILGPKIKHIDGYAAGWQEKAATLTIWKIYAHKWTWNKTISLRYEVIKIWSCYTKWAHSYLSSKTGPVASLNHLNLTLFLMKQQRGEYTFEKHSLLHRETLYQRLHFKRNDWGPSVYKLLRDETSSQASAGHHVWHRILPRNGRCQCNAS